MKDLFKGHHPWLLVLVIAVDIFSALTIRHSILSKGESEFNANVFFFIVLVAGLALYALLVEFISGKDMPLIGEREETEANLVQSITVSPPITDADTSQISVKEDSLSRRDFEDMMLSVVSKLRQETAIPPEETLKKKDETGVVSFNLNDMKESAASLVKSQEDAKYRFACEYTAEKLGSYIKTRDWEKLFFRLGLFQRASSPNWDPRTQEEIEVGIPAVRIEVASPVEKWALLHYGWNMGRLFGKPNNFITHFLKFTFHYHLDGLSDNQLPKKLKQNPRQGVIKIEEHFDKGLPTEEFTAERTVEDSETNTAQKEDITTADNVKTENIAVEATPTIAEQQQLTNLSETFDKKERSQYSDTSEEDEIEDSEDDDRDEDREIDDDDDEPMNDEEFAAFVERSMKRGADSRCLNTSF